METGYTHVYTGEGKGKTTCALGLALRACGAGKRVFIGQFLKSEEYSEIKALKEFLPIIIVEQFGRDVSAGYKKAMDALTTGGYDVIILDEINTAVHKGFLSEQEALALMEAKPLRAELILTGRYAADSVIKKADLVTEMRPVKHYFEKGVRARTGIEK
jgi:cob(I)alamin adenosyltransferase